jgi:hypothetical protein
VVNLTASAGKSVNDHLPLQRRATTSARAVLFACLAAHCPVGHVQVYKWVDEQGATRYSEKPPPGTKAQALKTPAQRPDAAVATDPGSKPRTKTWQEQELEFRRRQIEAEEARQKQEADDAKARRKAALVREGCIGARRDLAALQEQRPVYDIDERGERRFLDDKERAATIRQAQQYISKNCEK